MSVNYKCSFLLRTYLGHCVMPRGEIACIAYMNSENSYQCAYKSLVPAIIYSNTDNRQQIMYEQACLCLLKAFPCEPVWVTITLVSWPTFFPLMFVIQYLN